MKCAASQPVSQSASQAFWLSANEGEEANVACNGDGSVGGCMGYGFPVPVPARERVPGRLAAWWCAWWWCEWPLPEAPLVEPVENVGTCASGGDLVFSVSVSASSSSECSPCDAAADGVRDMYKPPERVWRVRRRFVDALVPMLTSLSPPGDDARPRIDEPRALSQ